MRRAPVGKPLLALLFHLPIIGGKFRLHSRQVGNAITAAAVKGR